LNGLIVIKGCQSIQEISFEKEEGILQKKGRRYGIQKLVAERID
jgi:hypothetical protein